MTEVDYPSVDIEEYDWHWYMVAAYDAYSDDCVIRPWPVCAAGFQEAMDVFEVLMRMSVDK